MRIGIVTFRSPAKRVGYHEQRISDEIKKRGHEPFMLRISNCVMTFDCDGTLQMRYGRHAFPKLDLVIPRVSIGENITLRAAAIEQMQMMNIPTVNEFQAILRAKNKLHTLQILSHYKVPVVKTCVIHNQKFLDQALAHVGSFPLVIKTISGSGGEGVAIVESKRGLKSAFSFIKEKHNTGNAMLLQEYIEEAKGKDLRLFVVGEKVVGAMQRTAPEGDFRSNIHQGGTGIPYQPTPEERHLAIRATKAIGLKISGVDIIETKHGPAVMEVNANPGFEGLEEVTGLNIAEAIVKYAVKFGKEYVSRES